VKGKEDVEKDKNPENEQESATTDHLIDQLDRMTNFFHQLPAHERFAYVTNADLYHYMLLVVNILKRVKTP
jgi:hypothetical protein